MPYMRTTSAQKVAALKDGDVGTVCSPCSQEGYHYAGINNSGSYLTTTTVSFRSPTRVTGFVLHATLYPKPVDVTINTTAGTVVHRFTKSPGGNTVSGSFPAVDATSMTFSAPESGMSMDLAEIEFRG